MAENELAPKIRPKDRLDLALQVDEASRMLGDQPLVPKTETDILSLSAHDLKERHPLQYSTYVRLLRATKGLRQDEHTEGGNFNEKLSDNEIKKLRFQLQIINGLDTYTAEHQNGENNKTLHERQMTVFEDIRNFVANGRSEGYIVLPTGTGKTVLFTEVVEAANTRSLIIVPSIQLVHQTAERLYQFAPDLKVGKVFGDEKDFDQDVTITTNVSLVNAINNNIIHPEEYGLVIIDEAHKNITDQKKQAIRKFSNALKLGFTATPDYSDQRKVADLLPYEIHNMSITEAIREELLCGVKVIVAKTHVGVDLSKVSVTQISGEREYTRRELSNAVNIAGRNKAAVDLYKQGFNDETAIAYCVTIQHAEDLAKEFLSRGISAASISGDTPKREQERIFKAYHDGEIKVLCNADLLIEGFDEPKTSVCFNLRPTLSKVLATQRAGRVLRLDRSQGQEADAKKEKKAIVVEFVDGSSEGISKQVLFSDILGSAEIPAPSREIGGERSDTVSLPQIKVEGIEVITNTEEVMQVTREIVEGPKEDRGSWLNITDIRNAYGFHPDSFQYRIRDLNISRKELSRMKKVENKETLYSQGLIKRIGVLEILRIGKRHLITGDGEELPEYWLKEKLNEIWDKEYVDVDSTEEKYQERVDSRLRPMIKGTEFEKILQSRLQIAESERIRLERQEGLRSRAERLKKLKEMDNFRKGRISELQPVREKLREELRGIDFGTVHWIPTQSFLKGNDEEGRLISWLYSEWKAKQDGQPNVDPNFTKAREK